MISLSAFGGRYLFLGSKISLPINLPTGRQVGNCLTAVRFEMTSISTRHFEGGTTEKSNSQKDFSSLRVVEMTTSGSVISTNRMMSLSASGVRYLFFLMNKISLPINRD